MVNESLKERVIREYIETDIKKTKQWYHYIKDNTVLLELRALDSLPEYLIKPPEYLTISFEINILEERQKIIDKYAKRNPLLKKAINKEISIFDVVSNLTEQYQKWKLFVPSDDNKKFYNEYSQLGLDKILYPFNDGFRFKDKLSSYIHSPITVGIGFLAFTSLCASIMDTSLLPKIMVIFTATGMGTLIGYLGAKMGYDWSISELNSNVGNAKYLQNIIDEIY